MNINYILNGAPKKRAKKNNSFGSLFSNTPKKKNSLSGLNIDPSLFTGLGNSKSNYKSKRMGDLNFLFAPRHQGANVKRQKQWSKMKPSRRKKLRKSLLDSDGDLVPNKYDCQPFNFLRQDSRWKKVKLKGDLFTQRSYRYQDTKLKNSDVYRNPKYDFPITGEYLEEDISEGKHWVGRDVDFKKKDMSPNSSRGLYRGQKRVRDAESTKKQQLGMDYNSGRLFDEDRYLPKRELETRGLVLQQLYDPEKVQKERDIRKEKDEQRSKELYENMKERIEKRRKIREQSDEDQTARESQAEIDMEDQIARDESNLREPDEEDTGVEKYRDY